MSAPQTVRPPLPPLSGGERLLLATAGVLGVGVGGVGLALSFDTVSAAGARWGFATPQMLPLAIDLAIPVFTIVNLLLIRMDMALSWVRFVPWFLTSVTCWLNVSAGHSVSAKVAHGTMPLLWVVLSEVVAHVYAARIGAVTGRRMEKIRRIRWVLAPLTTFALWRRMTLWEITSYTDALSRERERQLARADLREAHGWRWRSQTDRRTRVLLKLGELTPTGTEPVPAGEPVTAPAAPEVPAAGVKPKAPRRPARSAAKRPAGRRSLADLLTEARALTAQWPDSKITAEGLRLALRCGAGQARTLRDTLRGERANGPVWPLDTPQSATDAEGEAA
ncbi:Protein of unknown function [Streptomyces sp. DvalAA-14]|uniref:DUF2637 domain-containing protein n=1 Tax=unclassified Streptomyces TaxID=2593676 RepID=UPI00081B2C3F|nr:MULTISPECIES: DUF2637 domain-containing protein [unclassified Streptomyces]MYS22064.1 DUF2637 domain-containing protein [Streptomyces sp. SID4948]SCE07781.1 Protein of unknown function [Streptomyces sp. DvalAA-14]